VSGLPTVEQARQQTERVCDATLRERVLTRQLQDHASSQLLALLASRLNLLVDRPCDQCNPEVCPGGPALCALALSEKIEREAGQAARIVELTQALTALTVEKKSADRQQNRQHAKDVVLGDFLSALKEIAQHGTADDPVRIALDAYDAGIERAEGAYRQAYPDLDKGPDSGHAA
jgi:hypothetical protein